MSAIEHHPPRAGVDPIDSQERALTVVRLARHRPARAETIVILLDHARCGLAIVAVSGTEHPDDVLTVVERVTAPAALGGAVGAIIVASSRPGDEAGDADVDRWLELSDIADCAGVDLLEWFVIGERVTCPRDQLGELPRW
jgi:hypothetical protein